MSSSAPPADQTEAELKKLRSRVRRIVEFLPGRGWAATPDGHILYRSKSLRDFVYHSDGLGSSGGEENFVWKDVLLPGDYEFIASRWKAALQAEHEYEVDHQVLCADNTYRWIKTSAKPVRGRDGNILYWLGVIVDIDRPVRAAEQAQLNEKRLQTLLDAIPAPIWSTDERGNPLYLNRTHISQTGLSLDDFRSRGEDPLAYLASRTHPDDLEAVQTSVRRSYALGEPVNVRYRRRLVDGSYRWFNNRAEPLRSDAGEIIRWYGVIFDIDDEVNAQRELEKGKLELQRVVDTLPAMIWTADTGGQPMYFNERLKAWSGATVSQFADGGDTPFSMSSHFLIHQDDQEQAISSIQASFASGETWKHRFRLRRADGSFRWVEGRMVPLRDLDGTILHWYGLSLDVEEEVAAKAALQVSQDELSRIGQIASLAEVSAAIAHEISQPLAAIMTSASACRNWLENDPPNLSRAQASAERVMSNANIATQIITRIRSLFKSSPAQASRQSLNSLAADALDHISEIASIHEAKIIRSLSPRLAEVAVDPIEIQQVILNLLRNALDALEDTDKGDRRIVLRTSQNDRHVALTIEDNGRGICNAENIFEPFVTTKPNGMGIGLSVSRTIIAKHAGRLWGENTASGALFGFSLPIIQPDEERHGSP